MTEPRRDELLFDEYKLLDLISNYEKALTGKDRLIGWDHILFEISLEIIRNRKEVRIDEAKKWAWWKNGIQYVGRGVYTLKEAISEIEKDAPKEND